MATVRLSATQAVPVRRAVPVIARSCCASHHRPLLVRRTVCRSDFARELLPLESELPGTFNVSDYDHDAKVQAGAVHRLSENKYRLSQAFKACGVREDWRALMLAMAMQESTHLDVRERDASKDNSSNKAANATLFNLSVDLIEQTGYFQGTPGRDLSAWEWNLLISDTDEQVQTAVRILKCAFEKWGVENTLAFVRQGRRGFDPQTTSDWRSCVGGDQDLQKHVLGYLYCIKTYLHHIDNEPSLFWNQRRPDIYCEWI